ncbi:MAG: hypothetical protein R8G66_08460 [Cytophagales bacterium]|nr:hypothetical protein [Cytophagales bacterium]
MKRIITFYTLFFWTISSPQANNIIKPKNTHQFKAFNGIRFEYSLLLPEGYDRSKKYEIIALLCETHESHRAWDKTMNLLSDIDLDRSIVIVPKIPIGKDGWGTHPIHHAFNDLLKHVRTSHGRAKQKFHLIGYEFGQEVAFWWTYGSKELIASTSIINGDLWSQNHWDEKWYNNLMRSGIPIIAYESEEPSKFDMSKIKFRNKASLAQVIDDIEGS